MQIKKLPLRVKNKGLIVKILKRINLMDLNLRFLIIVLCIMAMPLLSFSVQAYDVPPKDQGHSGPLAGVPSGTPADEPGQCGVGDPINSKNGDFNFIEKDIYIPGVGFSLAIDRTYNNQNNLKEGPFGFGWTFNYDVTLSEIVDAVAPKVIIQRGDGMRLVFKANADESYVSPQGLFLTLTKISGVFSLTEKNGNVHRFDSNGRLISISDANNNQLTFAYDVSGKLTTSTDASSRSISLSYNTNNKITKIVDSSNRNFIYEYDENNNLIGFTNANNEKTEYVYDSSHRMTKKKDPKGVEVIRLTYNAQNKVTQQFFRGGFFNFTYYDGYTRVCNRRDNCTNYYYNGTGNPIRIHHPVIGSSHRTYNDQLRLTKYTDENNSSWNYTYDEKGNLLTTTDPNSHANQFSYESNYNKIASITDAKQNKTEYEYDAKGNLTKVTNALEQIVLKIASYNSHGNPLEVLDANEVKTELSYDVHGRLLSTTSDGSTTSFSYDNVGNLGKTIFPDGKTIEYKYNAANRLTEIIDGEGNKLKLTLDAVGNILTQDVLDKNGDITRKQTWVYDDFDRSKESITVDDRKTLFNYDSNDNLIKLSNALNNSVNFTFDELDRLTQVTDAISGITRFNYDNQGNITRVTDPEDMVTQYSYDKVGNLLKLISPDTGQTVNTYNEADNLLTSTDSRGITATYSYDELHRLTGVSYPIGAENIQYSYDNTSNGNKGIGRLTGYSDQSGNTEFQYDAKGSLITETHTIENQTYSTSFKYDAARKLTQLTYPSGRVVSYSYNTLGEVIGVNTTENGVTKRLASNIGYLSFGPMKSMVYGNGLNLNQTFDQNYRLLSKEINGLTKLNYSYSAIDNITGLKDDLNNGENQEFAYDLLSRLTSATGSYGDLTYTYDKVGNRTSEADDTVTDNYTYATNSHQLKSISGGNNTVFTYDSSGNTLTKDDISFSYNNRGRMAKAINNGVITDYLYNARGERVAKKSNGTVIHFHYDQAGRLISETTGTGGVIREYVYLGWGPLAAIDPFVDGGKVYFVHSDHLGTPKTLTDENGSTVWKASYEPFGEITQTVNLITFNLRFPGQYYDSETGLNYNYFRDYNPEIGRYSQSDLLGLLGGLNTYAYAYNSPVNLIDPYGNIPMETIWDIGIVVYDVVTGDKCALATDLLAVVTPYVPAGITKLPKAVNAAKSARNPGNGLKLNKQLGSQQQLGERGIPIAGAGSKTPLRDSNRLAHEYGSNVSDWTKRSSTRHKAPDGRSFQTHWYENSATGMRVEPKTIVQEYLKGK